MRISSSETQSRAVRTSVSTPTEEGDGMADPQSKTRAHRSPRLALADWSALPRGRHRTPPSHHARKPSNKKLEGCLERYRAELTAYCQQMLASPFEAEDAVQETFLRAWRGFDGFEGRASLRSWLYRIATNVCLDVLDGRKRQAPPMDLGPAREAEVAKLGTRREATSIEPIPDIAIAPDEDPAELVVARETIRLAFVAALQELQPRQRAVVLLCEVLRWKATEVAELLDTTVASVNSALQRARATLETSGRRATDPPTEIDDAQRRLLGRYVRAFEAYDIDAFTSLIREDATQSMPSYDLWLRGGRIG
jgi:RNA polymerase sigma-70 factor (ECF subfamily)